MANEDLLLRQMPHSLEGEQAVLGSMLIDPDCVKNVMDRLRPGDFYLRQNREIFETIYTMFSYARPIDGITVFGEMEKAGLTDGNTRSYLAQLMEITPTSANVLEYAAIVRDKALLRQVAQAAGEITALVQEGMGEAGEILEASEQKIYAIRRGQSAQEMVPLRQVLPDVLDRLSEMSEHENHLPGLSTGLSAIDQKITGLNKSDLILLAARPGMGKTSLALNVALNVAREGKTVAVFSLEMSREQLATRLLSSEALVENTRLRTGLLRETDWEKIAGAATVLNRLDIRIDDNPLLSVADMNAKCRRLDGLLQPIFQPHGIPVLEFDLQIVRFILLVVRVGKGQQIPPYGAGDIRPVKGHLHGSAAGKALVAHPAAPFHGGSVSLAFFVISGSVRTIPAGKM